MKQFYYSDKDNNELKFFINEDGNLFMTAGMSDDQYYNGYIVLDDHDVEDIINDLNDLLYQMRHLLPME